MTPDDDVTWPRTESEPSDEGRSFERILEGVAHAPPRAPPPEPLPGTRWGVAARYAIDQRLGRGGMGAVYAATDTLLGRKVALKVLDPGTGTDEAGTRSRVLREAGIAARVEHERVARVYDVGEHEGVTFIAMEFVRGVTLRAWLAGQSSGDGRGVAGAEVLTVTIQILEGLSALHESGVIHRDLKPENVMLSSGGVKLLDFGLAKAFVLPERPSVRIASAGSGDSPSVGPLSGTPGYMAPEQWEGGAVDQRADLFALGVIVYELVTSRRPFEGEGALEILEATLRTRPRFDDNVWSRVSPQLGAAARGMLARDPKERFSDAASVLRALAGARESSSARSLLPLTTSREIAEAPTLSAVPARKRPGRGRLWLAVIAVSAVAIVAGERLARRGRLAISARPPPGMALVDVGALTVGQPENVVKRQCAELGTKCNPQLMGWQSPALAVEVPAFYLDTHEVTNREMVAILTTLTSALLVESDEEDHSKRYVRFNAGLGSPEGFLLDLDPAFGGIEYTSDRQFRARAGREAWPVTQVTWFGASLYCETVGKRLPTENEWEAAARGSEDRSFPWGDALPRCGEVVVPDDGFLAADAGCTRGRAPVDVETAAQDVTPQGIYDLGGNVSEWTSTPYAEGGRASTAPSPQPPTAPRVLRGGSFFFSLLARPSVRNKRPANTAWVSVGFRCARDLEH